MTDVVFRICLILSEDGSCMLAAWWVRCTEKGARGCKPKGGLFDSLGIDLNQGRL
jgi:hypothetical protein